MPFVADERIREAMLPLGGGVFRLEGAPSGRFPFSSMKRRDGSPIQTGDTCCVSFVQAGGHALVAGATYAAGGAETLTVIAGKIFKTSAGDGVSIPPFDTGNPGECFNTTAADLLAQFTLDGVLLDPEKFRKTIIKFAGAFDDEVGIQDLEGIVSLGTSATNQRLAGILAMNKTVTEAADGVDRFSDPSGIGTVKRVGQKVAPTERNVAIVAGNVATLLDASDPLGQWRVTAWVQAAPANNASIRIFGHAADPVTSERIENGFLAWDLSGVNLRIRNDSGEAISLSYTVERIG